MTKKQFDFEELKRDFDREAIEWIQSRSNAKELNEAIDRLSVAIVASVLKKAFKASGSAEVDRLRADVQGDDLQSLSADLKSECKVALFQELADPDFESIDDVIIESKPTKRVIIIDLINGTDREIERIEVERLRIQRAFKAVTDLFWGSYNHYAFCKYSYEELCENGEKFFLRSLRLDAGGASVRGVENAFRQIVDKCDLNVVEVRILKYLTEGFSERSIAQKLGVSKTTIHDRIFVIRKKIAKNYNIGFLE